MGEREQCACEHDRASHHRRDTLRPPRDGGALDVIVTVYGRCLAAFCECSRYERKAEP